MADWTFELTETSIVFSWDNKSSIVKFQSQKAIQY
jgi:hypothetical protein